MSKYIASMHELEQLASELGGSQILAIDTEFLREKTYYAKLCLIQISNDTVSALIDPLALDNLDALGPLLADKNCTKIFHAGTQDIGILYHETGVMPTPIFDTQIAASLLGYPLQVGYGPLVKSVCDVKLPKADSYTDWSRRPLTNNQLKYAIDDVRYLPEVYRVLKERLGKKDRLKWIEKDFADMTNPNKYVSDPKEMWQHVKRISGLNRFQLAVAREVAAWREVEAMRRDIPRKWVIPDEAIVEIACKAPNTRARLLEVRGLSTRLSGRDVNQILEAVRKAKELPQEQWPKMQRNPKGNTEIDGAVDLMAALVEIRAKQNDVAVPLLASHAELAKLARGHRKDIAVLEGWRYDMVGHELIDLLEGRLALFLENGHVEVTQRHQQ